MALSLGAAGFICNRYFCWCLLLSYICELSVVYVCERSPRNLCLISLYGSPVGRFLFCVLTNDIYSMYYTYYKYHYLIILTFKDYIVVLYCISCILISM